MRVLTLPNVRVPEHGAGIGSTRAGKLRRNIMYIETRMIDESSLVTNAKHSRPDCKMAAIIFPPTTAREAREWSWVYEA